MRQSYFNMVQWRGMRVIWQVMLSLGHWAEDSKVVCPRCKWTVSADTARNYNIPCNPEAWGLHKRKTRTAPTSAQTGTAPTSRARETLGRNDLKWRQDAVKYYKWG